MLGAIAGDIIGSPYDRPCGSVRWVGWHCADLDRVLAEAVRSAEVTHNQPDGLLGAQAIAGAVFLAHTGGSKEDIRRFIETRVGYPLGQTIAALQRHYSGGGTCADTVPPAITAFL
jgi:ADP-ribosylglycohydrolase